MSVEEANWQRFSTKEKAIRWSGYLFAVFIVVFSWQQLNIFTGYVATAPEALGDLFSRMYPPNLAYTTEVIGPAITSINMAIVATFVAMIISFPIALLAAENTTFNKYTYWFGKIIISLNRSVNTIIYAIIFVIILGPGAIAGVTAMMVASIGAVSKLVGEEMEEIDRNKVEAIRATGGSRAAEIAFGILPQIKVFFITISTYEWDKNVRGSTVLGFVGAGGIGVPLYNAINTFSWHSALTALLLILVIVVFSEVISAYTRGKIR